MTVDEWPEWLPADWVIQIRKIDDRKVKCFIDPKGQKFYSRPQVDRHLKTFRSSTVSEKTNNDDGPTLDLSLEPDVPDTNEDPESTPKGQSTRLRRTGSSGKKYKETDELFDGDRSSSVLKSRGRKFDDSKWLPDGWTVEVKSKRSGQKYKIFTDPNGKKLFSKPQVLSYLASTNRSSAGKKEGDKALTETEKSQISNETRAITESARMTPDYEVVSSTPADGLPPGWIKEIRARPHGSGKKKDPYYLDPLSGYVFFSKLDALRYLDTGDIKKCAMRPLRRDMNQEINQITNTNQTDEELATPSDPTQETETPKALENGGSVKESKTERKVRSITGDGYLPMPSPISSYSSQNNSSQKDDASWLPEGWVVEMRPRGNGTKIKCYVESATRKTLYSKPQVLRHLGIGYKGNSNSISTSTNSGKRKRARKSYVEHETASSDSEFEDDERPKRSKKTTDTSNFEETIVTSPAEGLPPGWIKEVRSRICGTHIRKDPYYTDPVSGYVFRSKLDALRYLETGDITLCAMRPKKRDADGNEVTINDDGTPKLKPHKPHVEVGSELEAVDMDKEAENLDKDPKTTPDSAPTARRGSRERAATAKASASPVTARSSTRLKWAKPNIKTDTSLDENAPQPENGAVGEKEVAERVNLEKQSGDVEQLDYQLEDDSSWTDQFDFAVKTLVGEFPPNESGGVGDGSPAKED